MGATNSTLQGSLGYHVLEATGPAQMAGLQVYFDYITHINGIRVEPTFKFEFIESRAIGLVVYSSKTTKLRNVSIVPDQNGLGLKVKLCDFERAHERVWHVLSVLKESPAHFAGLRSNTDYIIGSNVRILLEKQDFGHLLTEYKEKEIELIVYNVDMDTIRIVTIIPKQWQGDGLLGCDIGYGYLHRIALNFAEPVSSPLKVQVHPSIHSRDRGHGHSHSHGGHGGHGSHQEHGSHSGHDSHSHGGHDSHQEHAGHQEHGGHDSHQDCHQDHLGHEDHAGHQEHAGHHEHEGHDSHHDCHQEHLGHEDHAGHQDHSEHQEHGHGGHDSHQDCHQDHLGHQDHAGNSSHKEHTAQEHSHDGITCTTNHSKDIETNPNEHSEHDHSNEKDPLLVN